MCGRPRNRAAGILGRDLRLPRRLSSRAAECAPRPDDHGQLARRAADVVHFGGRGESRVRRGFTRFLRQAGCLGRLPVDLRLTAESRAVRMAPEVPEHRRKHIDPRRDRGDGCGRGPRVATSVPVPSSVSCQTSAKRRSNDHASRTTPARIPLRLDLRNKWQRPRFRPGPRLSVRFRVYIVRVTPRAASVDRSSSPVWGKPEAC